MDMLGPAIFSSIEIILSLKVKCTSIIEKEFQSVSFNSIVSSIWSDYILYQSFYSILESVGTRQNVLTTSASLVPPPQRR